MQNRIKKSALASAALKLSQQVLHDLDSIVLNDSIPDVIRYGGEQICRITSAIAAAYAIDEVASLAEEYLPKPIRGILPLAAATIGVGTIVHYLGGYMNIDIQEGTNLMQTTQNIINSYQDSLAKLVTFNPTVHAGYLTGALISLKSGYRFIKNLGQTVMNKAEKKRVENNHREQQETQTTNEKNSNQIPSGL